MRKPLLFVFLALSLLQPSAQAVIIGFDSNHPRDTKRGRIFARMQSAKTPAGQTFKRQKEELHQLIRKLCALKEPEIVALLGPKKERQAGAFAIPSFETGAYIVSGLVTLDATSRKNHVDFYPVENFAGVEVIYGSDGVTPLQARIYFRVDDAFPALDSWSQLKARLAWDSERLSRLRARLNQTFPR